MQEEHSPAGSHNHHALRVCSSGLAVTGKPLSLAGYRQARPCPETPLPVPHSPLLLELGSLR